MDFQSIVVQLLPVKMKIYYVANFRVMLKRCWD